MIKSTGGTTTKNNVAYLLAGRESFCPSVLYGIGKTGFQVANNKSKEFTNALYGAVHAFWGFNSSSTASFITENLWTTIGIVGTLNGKGMITSLDILSATTELTFSLIAGTTAIFTDTTHCTVGVCNVKGPTGGIAQFKGLT